MIRIPPLIFSSPEAFAKQKKLVLWPKQLLAIFGVEAKETDAKAFLNRIAKVKLSKKIELIVSQGCAILFGKSKTTLTIYTPLDRLSLEDSFGRPVDEPLMVEEWDKTRFQLLEQIGEGCYGKVYQALDKRTNELCAIKSGKDRRAIAEEGHLLLKIKGRDHGIVHCLGCWDSPRKAMIGMELLGKNLGEMIPLHPKRVALYARQLFKALDYLHRTAFPDISILHRDIKPPNIALATDDTIRLLDFSLSLQLPKGEKSEEYNVITEAYRPPELTIEKPYDTSADIWSLGATLLVLSGLKIFNLTLERIAFDTLGNNSPIMNDSIRQFLTREGPFQDLINKMLTLDPIDRITAKDALEHPFLNI